MKRDKLTKYAGRNHAIKLTEGQAWTMSAVAADDRIAERVGP